MAPESPPENNSNTQSRSLRGWIRKVGVAGLIFFTIKGLLWLLIPYLIATYFTG